MTDSDAFVRFLATWALVHETADEGWKSAVARGGALKAGEMSGGPDTFVDGLAAMIADAKERLKAELASEETAAPVSTADISESLEELRFEVAELRGRIESLQASLDARTERSE